jgi:hypothetical protein
MAVGTVSAEHIIVTVQVSANPGRHGLLSDVKVKRRGDAPLHKEMVAALLKATNSQHTTIHIQQRKFGTRHHLSSFRGQDSGDQRIRGSGDQDSGIRQQL